MARWKNRKAGGGPIRYAKAGAALKSEPKLCPQAEERRGVKVLGLSYTMLYSDINLDNVALPPSNAVVLDGDFDPAFMHFFGANLIISF